MRFERPPSGLTTSNAGKRDSHHLGASSYDHSKYEFASPKKNQSPARGAIFNKDYKRDSYDRHETDYDNYRSPREPRDRNDLITDDSREPYENFDSVNRRGSDHERERDTRLPKQLYQNPRLGGYNHDRMYDQTIDEPMTISPRRNDRQPEASYSKKNTNKLS